MRTIKLKATSRLVGLAFGVLIGIVALAACGGPVPSGGASLPAHVSGPSAAPQRLSWILPAAKKGDLLYISDHVGVVDVFTYPGGTLVGQLGVGLPAGLCVDRAGDVYVAGQQSWQIVEYAHGGTQPIKTLHDLWGPYYEELTPEGCAVNPRNGDLAVTNIDTVSENVLIWRRAQGQPTGYSIPDTYAHFCSYDDKGNLYVDGEYYGSFKFSELRFRHKRFTPVHLVHGIVELAGGLQWDEKRRYLAVGDEQAGVVDHVEIKATKGTIVGSTPLSGSQSVEQFWIQGDRLIGPDDYAADVGIWQYPAGGPALKDLGGVFWLPFGAVVSRAR